LTPEVQVQFWQWEKGTKTYIRDGIQKEVKIMAKVLKSESEADAVVEFLSRMQFFKKTLFCTSTAVQVISTLKSKCQSR